MSKKLFVDWRGAATPPKTNSYTPVHHENLMGVVLGRLDAAGFSTTSINTDQSMDGNLINCHMGIERDYEGIEFNQEFVFMNSYNKTKPVLFASGARVFVCENGMIISEATAVRKHTVNVWDDVVSKCDEAINQMEINWDKTLNDVSLMKETEISPIKRAELLGLMFVNEGILSSTEINTIIREIKSPTFSEFTDDSLWSLYNACTFAMKDANIIRRAASLKALHEFSINYAINQSSYERT